MATKKSWSDLTPLQRRVVVTAGALETVVTMAALRDLARRPRSELRGPRAAWVLVCFVQPVGPITYFTLGRR